MDTETDTIFGIEFEPKQAKTQFVLVLFRSFRRTKKKIRFVSKRIETKNRCFEVNIYVIDMVKVIILLFRFVSEVFGYLGYIETPKQAVSILKRNNRNKSLVSDSAETNFGFSFDYVYQNKTSFIYIYIHIYIYICIYIFCGHLRTPLATVRPVGCTPTTLYCICI